MEAKFQQFIDAFVSWEPDEDAEEPDTIDLDAA
jgi:hypothetical protein